MLQFIKNQNELIAIDQVVRVDATKMQEFILDVYLKDGSIVRMQQLDAIETILALKGSMIEGMSQIKWKKGAWIVHNMLAHPLMQVLALLGAPKMGLWIHDASVPGVKHIKYLKQKKA